MHVYTTLKLRTIHLEPRRKQTNTHMHVVSCMKFKHRTSRHLHDYIMIFLCLNKDWNICHGSLIGLQLQATDAEVSAAKRGPPSSTKTTPVKSLAPAKKSKTDEKDLHLCSSGTAYFHAICFWFYNNTHCMLELNQWNIFVAGWPLSSLSIPPSNGCGGHQSARECPRWCYWEWRWW